MSRGVRASTRARAWRGGNNGGGSAGATGAVAAAMPWLLRVRAPSVHAHGGCGLLNNASGKRMVAVGQLLAMLPVGQPCPHVAMLVVLLVLLNSAARRSARARSTSAWATTTATHPGAAGAAAAASACTAPGACTLQLVAPAQVPPYGRGCSNGALANNAIQHNAGAQYTSDGATTASAMQPQVHGGRATRAAAGNCTHAHKCGQCAAMRPPHQRKACLGAMPLWMAQRQQRAGARARKRAGARARAVRGLRTNTCARATYRDAARDIPRSRHAQPTVCGVCARPRTARNATSVSWSRCMVPQHAQPMRALPPEPGNGPHMAP